MGGIVTPQNDFGNSEESKDFNLNSSPVTYCLGFHSPQQCYISYLSSIFMDTVLLNLLSLYASFFPYSYCSIFYLFIILFCLPYQWSISTLSLFTINIIALSMFLFTPPYNLTFQKKRIDISETIGQIS